MTKGFFFFFKDTWGRGEIKPQELICGLQINPGSLGCGVSGYLTWKFLKEEISFSYSAQEGCRQYKYFMKFLCIE